MTAETITISTEDRELAIVALNVMWRDIADKAAETIRNLGDGTGAFVQMAGGIEAFADEGREKGMPYLRAYRALCGYSTDGAAVREDWDRHIAMLLAPVDDSGIA